MSTTTIRGKISFINHDKDYATIDYTLNGKKKSINGNIGEKEQEKLKAEKIIKRTHQFHVGDEVDFMIALSPRGDKMIATCIEFKFNNALDSLINKSFVENRFVGYLKKVEEDYFVKETGSYIFFPLKLSAWEKKPQEILLNEPYFFSLENTDKPDKAYAIPFKSHFIPEYQAAMKAFNSKTPLDAEVYKITAHGIFVNLFGGKIQGRIPLAKDSQGKATTADEKIGDTIKILISFLSPYRIIIEKARH